MSTEIRLENEPFFPPRPKNPTIPARNRLQRPPGGPQERDARRGTVRRLSCWTVPGAYLADPRICYPGKDDGPCSHHAPRDGPHHAERDDYNPAGRGIGRKRERQWRI